MQKFSIDFLYNNRDRILNDPVLFIVIFLIGLGLGWFLSYCFQKNTLETKEERLKQKDDKIQNQKEQIESLEKQKLALEEIQKQQEQQIQELQVTIKSREQKPTIPAIVL